MLQWPHRIESEESENEDSYLFDFVNDIGCHPSIRTHFHARVRSTMLLFLSLKGSGFNSIIELLQGIVHIYRLVVLVLGKLEEYLLNIFPLFLSELLDNYQYKSGIKSNRLNNIYLNRVSIVVQQKRLNPWKDNGVLIRWKANNSVLPRIPSNRYFWIY